MVFSSVLGQSKNALEGVFIGQTRDFTLQHLIQMGACGFLSHANDYLDSQFSLLGICPPLSLVAQIKELSLGKDGSVTLTYVKM